MERGSDHGRDSGASGVGRQSAGRTSQGRLSGGRESGGRESARDSAGRDSGRESAGQRRSSRSRGRKRKPRKDGGSEHNGRRTSKQRDAMPPGDGSRGCFFACFGAQRSTSPSATETPLFTPLPPPPASAAGSMSVAQSFLTQTASRTNLGSRTSQAANDNIYSYSPLTSMHRRNADSEPDYNNKSSPPHKPPSLSESLDQENYKIRQAAPIPPYERTRLNSGPLSTDTVIQSHQDLPPLPGAGHSTTRRRRRSTAEYSNTSTSAAHLLLEHHSAASRGPGGLTCSFSAPLKVGLGQHRLARRVSAADSEDLEGELERPFRSSLTRHSARRSSASGHISTARISRASSAALPDFPLDDTLTLPAIKPVPPQVPAAAEPPRLPINPAYSPSASPPRVPRLPRSALPPLHTPLALHLLKLPPDVPHPTMIPTMDLGLSSFPKAVPLPQLKLNTTALPAAAWGLLGRQVRGGSCSPGGAAAAMRDSYDSSPPASPSGRPARSANSSSAMQRSCLAASRVLQLDRLPSASLDDGGELNAQIDLEEGGDDFGGMPAAIRLTLESNEPFELHPGPQSPLLSDFKSPFLNSRQESTPSQAASLHENQEAASMLTSAIMHSGTASGAVQNPARQTSLYKLPSFSLFLQSEATAEQGQSQLHSEPSSKRPIQRSFEQISENHDSQPETSPKATLASAAFEGPSYSRPIGLPRVRPLFASATPTTPTVAKEAAAAASVPLPWRSVGGSLSRNHNTEAWTKPGSPPTALGKRVPRSSFTRASRVFPPASSPSPSTSPGPTMKQAQTLTACLHNHTADTSIPAYTSSRYPATTSIKIHCSAPASPTKDLKNELREGEQLDLQEQPAVAAATNTTAVVRKAELLSTSSRSLMQATISSASPARQRQAFIPTASPPRKWVRSVTIACAVADPSFSTTPFLDDYGRTSPVHLKTPALLMMMLGKQQGGSSLPASKQSSHHKQTAAPASIIPNRHAASQQKQSRSQLDTRGAFKASSSHGKGASPACRLSEAPILSDAAFADQGHGQDLGPGSQASAEASACSAGRSEDEESLPLFQSPSQQLLPLLMVPWQLALSADPYQAPAQMLLSPDLEPQILSNNSILQVLPQQNLQPLLLQPMHLHDGLDHAELLMSRLQCACPSDNQTSQNSIITPTQQQLQQHNLLLDCTSQLCEVSWKEDGSPPTRHNLYRNRSITTATTAALMSTAGSCEMADTTTLLLYTEYHELELNSTALSEHGCRKQSWGSSCSSPCTWGSTSAQESFTNQSFTNQALSPGSVSNDHSPKVASRQSVQRCLDARFSQARANHQTTAPYEYPLEGDLTTTPSPSPLKLSTSHSQSGQAASAAHVHAPAGVIRSAFSSPTTFNSILNEAASPVSQESWVGFNDSAAAASTAAEVTAREDTHQAWRSGSVCASVLRLEILHRDSVATATAALVQRSSLSSNLSRPRHVTVGCSSPSIPGYNSPFSSPRPRSPAAHNSLQASSKSASPHAAFGSSCLRPLFQNSPSPCKKQERQRIPLQQAVVMQGLGSPQLYVNAACTSLDNRTGRTGSVRGRWGRDSQCGEPPSPQAATTTTTTTAAAQALSSPTIDSCSLLSHSTAASAVHTQTGTCSTSTQVSHPAADVKCFHPVGLAASSVGPVLRMAPACCHIDQPTDSSLVDIHPASSSAAAAAADCVEVGSEVCTDDLDFRSDTERDVYFDAAGTDTAADTDTEAFETAVSSFDSDREAGRHSEVRSSCGTIGWGRPVIVRDDHMRFSQGRWVLMREEVSAISEPRSFCL